MNVLGIVGDPAKILRDEITNDDPVEGNDGAVPQDKFLGFRQNESPRLQVCLLARLEQQGVKVRRLISPDTKAELNVSEALVARLFGLTPTEARVAAAIARGQRTEQIALDMGISSTTLAFQMRNIFRKAGVGRQQDLMALVFRSALFGQTAART